MEERRTRVPAADRGHEVKSGARVIEVKDERDPLARKAIELISESIWDVHPTRYLLAEIEDVRLNRTEGGEYHLLAMLPPGSDEPIAAAAGIYLEAVNVGFVAYLAVSEDVRGKGLGQALREELVNAFRGQALRAGLPLRAVVGEVERDSAWLRRLVREGRAIPLDVPYFHPWMYTEGKYALYFEPLEDKRWELPPKEVAAIIETIWRRAYGVDDPDRSKTFRYMMSRLDGRERVGADPQFHGA